MPVKIENLTNRLVLLRLNSGQTLHLSPRETSEEVRETEVMSNVKVQKLEGRRVISVHKVSAKKRSDRSSKGRKAGSEKEEK